jgi:hypothetical protein
VRARHRLHGPATTVARGLAAGRIAIGSGIWLAPRPSIKALGFDPANPQAIALARLAGTRDLALGALTIVSLRDLGAARRLSVVNALVDAADATALTIPFARRHPIGPTAALGAASAIFAALAGAWIARELGVGERDAGLRRHISHSARLRFAYRLRDRRR